MILDLAHLHHARMAGFHVRAVCAVDSGGGVAGERFIAHLPNDVGGVARIHTDGCLQGASRSEQFRVLPAHDLDRFELNPAAGMSAQTVSITASVPRGYRPASSTPPQSIV